MTVLDTKTAEDYLKEMLKIIDVDDWDEEIMGRLVDYLRKEKLLNIGPYNDDNTQGINYSHPLWKDNEKS